MSTERPTRLGDTPLDWRNAALIAGEHIAANGPAGYYAYTPEEWLAWMRQQIAEHEQQTAWQLIETVPHNKPVLVWFRNALGNTRTVKAIYYDAGRCEMSDNVDESFVNEDGTNREAGWWEDVYSTDETPFLDGKPLGWQPLPAPPSKG